MPSSAPELPRAQLEVWIESGRSAPTRVRVSVQHAIGSAQVMSKVGSLFVFAVAIGVASTVMRCRVARRPLLTVMRRACPCAGPPRRGTAHRGGSALATARDSPRGARTDGEWPWRGVPVAAVRPRLCTAHVRLLPAGAGRGPPAKGRGPARRPAARAGRGPQRGPGPRARPARARSRSRSSGRKLVTRGYGYAVLGTFTISDDLHRFLAVTDATGGAAQTTL